MKTIIGPLTGIRRLNSEFGIPPQEDDADEFGRKMYNFASTLTDTEPGGFEREVSDHIRARAEKAGCWSSGVFIPSEFWTRDLTIRTSGSSFVETEVLPTITDALRPYSAAISLGAQVLDGLTGNVSWPQWSSPSTPAALAETGLVTPSGQQTATMSLKPHRISVQTIISKQLVSQAAMSLEQLIKQECLKSIASIIDYYALAGSGTAPQPLGILHQSVGSPPSVRQISSVTFGAAASWSTVCKFPQAVATSNVPNDGSAGWVLSPAAKYKFDTTEKAVGFPIYLYLVELHCRLVGCFSFTRPGFYGDLRPNQADARHLYGLPTAGRSGVCYFDRQCSAMSDIAPELLEALWLMLSAREGEPDDRETEKIHGLLAKKALEPLWPHPQSNPTPAKN
jgi:hypothetical protein